MKKFAIAAAAVAALSSGVVNAYTMGTFSNGFVVPNVIHNGATDTTVVGVTAAAKVGVNWVFYDQDSKHKRDGCFNMTANDFEAFNWNSPKSGTVNLDVSSLAGTRGYLVFAVGSETTGATAAKATCDVYASFIETDLSNANGQQNIAGAAFQVLTTKNDVAFVPVIDGPLRSTSKSVDFALNSTDPIVTVDGAAPLNAMNYMRFYTAGGAKTSVVIWNTGAQDATKFQSTGYPFDTEQKPYGSVSFTLAKKELNVVDAGTLVGTTPTDGFFKWQASATATAGQLFTYSVIDAPAFGALQSIVNPYTK